MTWEPRFDPPLPNQELLDAAADALERLRARSGESADEWAERLAPTFFVDLDRRVPCPDSSVGECIG